MAFVNSTWFAIVLAIIGVIILVVVLYCIIKHLATNLYACCCSCIKKAAYNEATQTLINKTKEVVIATKNYVTKFAGVNEPKLISKQYQENIRINRIKKTKISIIVPQLLYQELVKLDCVDQEEAKELKEELSQQISEDVVEFINKVMSFEFQVTFKKNRCYGQAAVRFFEIEDNDEKILVKTTSKQTNETWNDDHIIEIDNENDNDNDNDDNNAGVITYK
eukprot:514784_1